MVSKKKTIHMFVIYSSLEQKVINCSCFVNEIELMVTNISILFIFISSCLYSSLIMSTCQMATKTLEITR